jgi:hypothetical protein
MEATSKAGASVGVWPKNTPDMSDIKPSARIDRRMILLIVTLAHGLLAAKSQPKLWFSGD